MRGEVERLVDVLVIGDDGGVSEAIKVSTELAKRSPRTLIYLVGDMVYLLFLDSTGAMVDFVLLYN